MTNIRTAVVSQYFPERGFGWLLETLASGRKITHFFHITSCGFVPEVGQQIQFEIGIGRKGPAAINLELDPAPQAIAGIDALAADTPKSGGVA